MRKLATRRSFAMVFLGMTVLGAFALAANVSRRRARDVSTADAARPKPPAPAGGAASSGPDGEGADASGDAGIVEDARLYTVRTWSFPLDRFALHIEDVGMTSALTPWLEKLGAELVVNAGFFDPAKKPVGLAMSEGLVLSRFSLGMSGGVVTSDGDSARLWETESFVLPEATKFAVQCKPRLVVDGAPNVKSDDGHRSERTALCLRDGGRVIDIVIVRDEAVDVKGPSLFALGRYLASHGCEQALNLDGGPSTGVAWRDEEDKVRSLDPRGPVRHVIAFKKR